MKRENIPGIYGIDTRQLTKILREEGSLLGKIVFEEDQGIGENRDFSHSANNVDKSGFYNPGNDNLVAEVSCKEVLMYGNGDKKVVLVDCGTKLNIIRELISRGIKVIRVPWDYDFNSIEFDGLMISNGPGNPDHCIATIENIRKALNNNKPIFGICLGNQLLSKAAGAKTYKLKYGHRSHNQPVRRVGDNQCFITSQNHGYAVDELNLSNDWEPWFVNMNDGTNEGIRHKTKPFYSVQFHPESKGGPNDTRFFFDEFIQIVNNTL